MDKFFLITRILSFVVVVVVVVVVAVVVVVSVIGHACENLCKHLYMK